MIIKTMTIDDYDDVFNLWDKTPEMSINNIDDSREGIEKYLLRNPTTSFIAIDNKKIVGAIIAGHDGRRGFIQHMTVSTKYRKQGIASKLLDATMDALEKEEIHKVALLNFKMNEMANVFWDKRGFVIREDVYYRNKNIYELEYRKNEFRQE